MKTTINTRVIAVALATIFTVGFTSVALATGGKNTDGKNVIPVELKYLGKFKNQPLFELNFTNAEANEFTVVIRDEFGTTLYKDNVKGGTASKKFLLNTEELGNVNLEMEIIGKKTDKTVVFAINQNSRVVEDVVVNKLQ